MDMVGGSGGPYPQPYIMQDEQRAQPRIERPAPADNRMGLLKILVGLAILTGLFIVAIVLATAG